MIRAEHARRQTENCLSKVKENTWETIEKRIKEAIEIGYTKCSVLIRKEILDDISWSLEHEYGYILAYEEASSVAPNHYYMTISW